MSRTPQKQNRRPGEVSFRVSKKDSALIQEIADRAVSSCRELDHLNTAMDVTACHANGNPLRLAELLAADDFNFSHDIFGIARHLDRETGKLLRFFSPRYSKHEPSLWEKRQ